MKKSEELLILLFVSTLSFTAISLIGAKVLYSVVGKELASNSITCISAFAIGLAIGMTLYLFTSILTRSKDNE